MEEPLRQDDDELNPARRLSPQERANQRWGINGGSPAAPEPSAEPSDRPSLRALEGGGEGDGVPKGSLSSVGSNAGSDSNKKSLTSDELADAEASGGAAGAATSQKDSKEDAPWQTNIADSKPGRLAGLKSKKSAVTIGIAGLLGGGLFGIFTVLQGPFQVIHFLNWLDRPHFSSMNDTTNSRANKLLRRLRYRGQPPQLRRLGGPMNKYANRVEKRWRDNGFDPKYNDIGQLTHFELGPDVDTRMFTDNGIRVNQDGNIKYVNFDDILNSNASKQAVKGISEAAGYNKTMQSLNTRVLGKRAGVSFKRFGKLKPRPGESILDYHKRVREDAKTYFKRGASVDVRINADDGDPDKTSPEEEAADKTKQNVDDIRAGGSTDIRAKLQTPDSIAGALCLMKGASEAIPRLQYANVVLPLIRQGMSVMSMGSQIMSGKGGVDMREVGAFVTRFHTEEQGSWVTAKAMQAEMGVEQNGKDINPLSKPGKTNFFKQTFDAGIDKLNLGTPLNATCAVNNHFLGGIALDLLTGGLIGAVAGVAIDTVLQAFDVDIIGILASILSNESVASDPAGVDWGNNASYGARLAANDAALAIGAQELSENQEIELDEEVRLAYMEDFQEKPLSTRMFALTEPDSLLSRVAISSYSLGGPANIMAKLGQLPGKIFSGLSNMLLSAFNSPVKAAALNNGYDYGFPMYGYTPDERDHPNNDPYKIAEDLDSLIKTRTAAEEECERRGHGPHPPPHKCDYVPSNISEFNRLYEKCFGTRIIEADPDNPESIETFESLDSVNYFAEGDEGRPEKCEKGQPDTEIHLTTTQAEAANDLRLWRFYLADTVTGHSMLCYEGEESSCGLFGIVNDSAGGDEE